jgi:hypothetical protein
MTNFRSYLSEYINNSNGFTDLSTVAQTIRKQLENMPELRIKGDTISVGHYADEINYSHEVLRVFSRFTA